VSFLCDRKTTQIAGGQSGFISFVVLPVFRQLSCLSPNIEEVQVAKGLKNIKQWEILAQEESEEEEE